MENVSFEPKLFEIKLATSSERPNNIGDGLHYTLRRLKVPTVSLQFSDAVTNIHTALICSSNSIVKPVLQTHRVITDE